MPLSDTYPRVLLSSIFVPTEVRQRQKDRLPDGRVATGHVEASIGRIGVLMPLLVEPASGLEGWRLISGECRLQSCRNLVASGRLLSSSGQDLTTIPVRLASDLSPLESSLFELTENIKRSDLEWQDTVRSVAGIHSLLRKADPDWTLGETGEVCSLTTGIISMYLRVASELSDPRILEAETVREAYNVLTRREVRALGDAIDELTSVPEPIEVGESGDSEAIARAVRMGEGVEVSPGRVLVYPRALESPRLLQDSILQEDFLRWAPKYSGPPFNFLHCDFPYGINVFSGSMAQGSEDETSMYSDAPEVYFSLIRCLCGNLDRLLAMSSHVMFWFSDRHDTFGASETRRLFQELAPSVTWTPFPMIWHKSDHRGIAGDAKRHPRHVYETALLGSRGGRPLLRQKDDLYSAPTDRSLHASTKPEPMLRHFFEMIVDGNTKMLDPTCGSGAALRAAESLGAEVLGLEVDGGMVETARSALSVFRNLRQRSGGER